MFILSFFIYSIFLFTISFKISLIRGLFFIISTDKSKDGIKSTIVKKLASLVSSLRLFLYSSLIYFIFFFYVIVN